MKKNIIIIILSIISCLMTACTERQDVKKTYMEAWKEKADLSDHMTSEELYEAALDEETLVIYSVSSRAFDVKESFEKEYPGLIVEIRDIRGSDVVDMLLNNYEKEDYSCDLVICSDCDGSLYQELIEPGILYSYIPWDIEASMKEGHTENELDFLGESIMFFYNNNVFSEQPFQNIWELTNEEYKGRIIMANPLNSFSTYGFCASVLSETELMESAYEEYFNTKMIIPEGKTAGEIFWDMVAPNIIFTNSSDEVVEEIGNNDSNKIWIGIMISSKMRYLELGYHFTPIYNLEPFAAVYTPNSVTIAGGSKNINSAKLFIRYLLGETDGTGEGLKPFSTIGTWSTRIDVQDGNPVPLKDINYVTMNKQYIYDNREQILDFWRELLKENVDQ